MTITSPASGTWLNANATLSVTNADTGGSLLNLCQYKVISNGVTDTLTLVDPGFGRFTTLSDGAGGTAVELTPVMLDAVINPKPGLTLLSQNLFNKVGDHALHVSNADTLIYH